MKDEPEEQQKLRAGRVSSILRVKHYCPTTAKHFEKKLSWEHMLSLSQLEERDLTFYFFWINFSIFESEFFDKMRASSLRLAENREEGTRLNHSRFLASLDTCIHESFVKNKLLC